MVVGISRRTWPGRITISDPVGLINEIAKRYETLERVIMEYVDNAIDDADDMAKGCGGNYPHCIRITLIIDKEHKRVIISDNCRGMDFDTLSVIVHKIGESQKRQCSWLNGQFGFGVHAFRGFCKELLFHTKHKNDEHYSIKINKDRSKVSYPRTVQEGLNSDTKTGTVVVLQKFDEDIFEGISVEVIKEEIETHFETLLKKDNLIIKVGYKGEKPFVCKDHDYGKIAGKTFRKLERIVSKNEEHDVEIFFKVTDIPNPLKPRFFAKGRRILFIKDDKSFIGKSKYRTSVWDHSNLTGYVEVGNLVKPIITRDGFERGKNRTLLYNSILQCEDDIKEALEKINKKYEDHSLSQLEDVIAKALRKLAREDALRFRVEHVPVGTGDISLAKGGVSYIAGPGRGHVPGEWPGEGSSGEGKGSLQGSGNSGPLPQPGTSEYSGTRRKRPGFSLRFINIPPDSEGTILRSQFTDGTISINMEHQDFRERIERTRKGELRVTPRMLSYIAAVISIYYKDQYYKKYHSQPDKRTDLFDEQVDFIFRLEKTLLPFLKEIKDIIVGSDDEG